LGWGCGQSRELRGLDSEALTSPSGGIPAGKGHLRGNGLPIRGQGRNGKALA
jgi:hypothetical protein